jgi:hypothetical protein
MSGQRARCHRKINIAMDLGRLTLKSAQQFSDIETNKHVMMDGSPNWYFKAPCFFF